MCTPSRPLCVMPPRAECRKTHGCMKDNHKECPFSKGKCEYEGGCEETVPGNRKHKSLCQAHSKALIASDTARSLLRKSATNVKDEPTLTWLASDEGKAASADEYNKRKNILKEQHGVGRNRGKGRKVINAKATPRRGVKETSTKKSATKAVKMKKAAQCNKAKRMEVLGAKRGRGRVDTSGDGQSAFVLSEFEARWGATSAHAADADKRHPPPSRFVVDLGAHDGLWRSRSHFLVQHGWGALLVEPHPGSFALLRQTWPLATELHVAASHEAARPADPRPWDPTAGDERAVTIIAHAGVGSRVGYGAVVSRGQWDNTEARLEEDDHRGTIRVYPIQDLLALAHVPTRFAVLSFSVEWERPLRYAEALVGMMEGGWRADFLVLATGGDAAVRHALEDAGYEWLKTMGGDDVYYDGRAATH